MEKETVLARIRLTLELNQPTKAWLRAMPNAWFAQRAGDGFLSEFGGTWERLFVEAAQDEVQGFFRQRGVSAEHLPVVRRGERYTGSWIAEAAVVMFGSVGTAYTILKGISELPEIADGLTPLKHSVDDQVDCCQDLVEAFPDSASVDQAVRLLVRLSRSKALTGSRLNKTLQPTSRIRKKSKSKRRPRAARG